LRAPVRACRVSLEVVMCIPGSVAGRWCKIRADCEGCHRDGIWMD
jgi:hypothetical protein